MNTIHRAGIVMSVSICAIALCGMLCGCESESNPVANNDSTGDELICPYKDDSPVDDPENPIYEVVSPNGGEQFAVNDTVTIQTRSDYMGEAELYLVIGKHKFGLSEGSFFTGNEPTTHTFVMPSSFDVANPSAPTGVTTISTLTDSAVIQLVHYDNGAWYDYSDCYFSITQ